MKKTLFSIILTIALSIPLFAQEWVNVTSEKPSSIEANLIKSTESSIIVNAHRVNQGESLEIKKGSDFFFMQRNSPKETQDLVVMLRL